MGEVALFGVDVDICFDQRTFASICLVIIATKVITAALKQQGQEQRYF
jgi:hypothetical protein